MPTTRSFSSVTSEILSGLKEFGRVEHGIVYDPPEGTVFTATRPTRVGDCVVEFVHDSARNELKVTIVKKPPLLPERLFWDGLVALLERFREGHSEVLSRDDIINGYRFILGRHPASEEVITLHQKNHASIEEFRASLFKMRRVHSRHSPDLEPMKMGLWHQFLTNDQKIIHKTKHYFPIYERHFQSFVNKSLTFIEIGCGEGGSLQMWKRYFGPYARIVGVDIDPSCEAFEEDQIQIRIGPQQNPDFLQSLIDELGKPDIVLDDGSHIMSDVSSSFAFLYPHLSQNGVYMVEDLGTAYWEEYEGGLRTPGSFIEISKRLIDELNADYTNGRVPPTDFTRSTLSIHFYDGAIVFERGSHTPSLALRIGTAES